MDKQQQEIKEAIADSLTIPVADIDVHASLQDDLGLNPVEIADLLGDLSQRFHILFESTEVASIKTVGNLIESIEDKLLE